MCWMVVIWLRGNSSFIISFVNGGGAPMAEACCRLKQQQHK